MLNGKEDMLLNKMKENRYEEWGRSEMENELERRGNIDLDILEDMDCYGDRELIEMLIETE